MKNYTFRVICYVDVTAEDEERAYEKAEEMFPVEPYDVELYEIDDADRDWDLIADGGIA